MTDKCFCHLTIDGESFKVKDAEARQNIEKTNNVNANYYDEIKYRYLRKDNTNYYLIDIPKVDSEGNLINIYVSEHEEGLSPNEDAIKNNTNVTINASLAVDLEGDGVFVNGSVIANGVILNNNQITGLSNEYQYLGIKEDNTIVSYQANSTTAEEMLNDGVKNAFLVFGQSVKNGVYSELSHYLTAGPGQYIGQKPYGDIVILTNDGRNDDNVGFTGEQGSQILIDEGCVNVWILDGGGSTSTSFKGSKLNMNVDDNGRTDRSISYLLNVKKEINNKQVADVYSFIGEMKQLIMSQLNPLIEHKNKKVGITRFNINNYKPTTTAKHILPMSVSSPNNTELIEFINDNGTSFHLKKPGAIEIDLSLYLVDTVDSNIQIDIVYNGTINRTFKQKLKANENQTISINTVLNTPSEDSIKNLCDIRVTSTTTVNIYGTATIKAWIN